MAETPRPIEEKNNPDNPLESKEVIAGVNIPEAEPQTPEITPPSKEPASSPVKKIEIEKTPADDKSLAEAKEHLEKMFGPDSPINVGAGFPEQPSNPEQFSNIETVTEKNVAEQAKPVDVDKTIPVEKVELQKAGQQENKEQVKDKEKKEAVDLSSTQIDTENIGEVAPKISAETEAIKEGVKAEEARTVEEKQKSAEELRQKQIEYAKTELKAQLEVINNAREKRDRATELSSLKEAEGSYEVAEGKALMEEASNKAEQEAKQENLVKMSPKVYREKYTKIVENNLEHVKRLSVLDGKWEHLSEKERAQYTDQNDFNKKTAEAIDAKIEELGKNGISLSHSAVYAMMEKGIMPENIQVLKGWKKFWNGAEIAVSEKSLFSDKKPTKQYISKDVFFKKAKESEEKFLDPIKKSAKSIIDKNILSGQERWRAKRNKVAREIIGKTVEKYKREAEEARRQQQVAEQERIQKEEEQEEAKEEQAKKKTTRKGTLSRGTRRAKNTKTKKSRGRSRRT